MTTLLYYGLQVTILSGILYSYYHFVLRNKRFHKYNRFYLLVATILSITIPFSNIPVYFTEAETDSSFVLQTLSVISSTSNESLVVSATSTETYYDWFTWKNLATSFYILIAFTILLKIVFSLLKIRRIIKTNPVEQLDKIHFVNTEEPGTPFSFFRWLFWNKKIELQSEKGEQIFRHELFHIEQKHSWDILYIELLAVIGWVNPFFHLIKKEIKAIHEFLADRFAVTENTKWQYAELLLMQALNTNQHLVNPFFHNQIKRRIAMITTSKKTSHQYLRKMMVLPLTAFAVILFAFSYKNKKETPLVDHSNGPVTVVIDAGHGGADKGAIAADGTAEKDIALAIAQKIKALNEDENIKIVLTRDADILPELRTRTDFGNQQGPTLFLSLHVNSSPNKSKTGFEVVIPSKTKNFSSENKILASILLGYLAQNYTVDNSAKQRDQSVWVLENSNCPSALLECGYISNEKDFAYIKNTDNQEKIAKSILLTIDQYLMQQMSSDWEERKAVFLDTSSALNKVLKKAVNGTRSGHMEFYDTKNAIYVSSDSIVFESDAKNSGTDIDHSLIIVNGQKKSYDYLLGKKVIAKKIIIYPANDNYAMKLYGAEAKNGVTVLENVSITKFDPVSLMADTTKPSETDNKIFAKVEIEPAFPGGDAIWRQYLERNLNASIPAINKAPEGAYTVVVQFIVGIDGFISDVRALTKHGYGMEEEAMRVIKRGPKWVPAIQNGKVVRAYKKQLITFIMRKADKVFKPDNSNSKEMLNEVVVADLTPAKRTEIKENFTIYNKTASLLKSNVPIRLDPRMLYIGIDNTIKIHAPGYDISKISAEIKPHGTVSRYDNDFSIRVQSVSDNSTLSFYTYDGNKKILLKETVFPTRTIPEYEQPVEGVQVKLNIPEISISNLQKASVTELLQLPPGTEVISYTFTIDTEAGEIVSVPNTGNEFNQATRYQIKNAKAGKLITIDRIIIRDDGKDKKIASLVYKLVD